MTDRRELALLLRRLTVELDAVGQRFADLHGLNRTDVRALVAIMDAARGGESLTAGAAGRRPSTCSSASVTALVDRLERVGHVRRVRDADDRRRVALEMSDSAMAAGAEHFGGAAARPRRRDGGLLGRGAGRRPPVPGGHDRGDRAARPPADAVA